MLFKIKENILHKIGSLSDMAGIEAYVVGGYVRDLVMGLATKDIDIVIVGEPVDFARSVAKELKASNLVIFRRFRTAQMQIENTKIEIVGARKESYVPESRKPVVIGGSLEEDLSRRDFTMNAMAISLNFRGLGGREFGELVDPYGGLDAIERKIIDTPLDPAQTFSEDPLRVLRAVRFAGRFGFSLAPRVREAISSVKSRLTVVSRERITDELLKILSSDHPSAGLKLLYDLGLIDYVFPDLSQMVGVEQRQDHHHKDVFLHTLKVVDNLAAVTDNVWLRFAGLVHDIAKPETKRFVEGVGWTFHGHDEIGARKLKKIFQQLRLPMEKLPYVEKLVRLHLRPMALAVEGVTDSAVRRLLFEAGEDFEDLMKLCRADITSKNKDLIREYTQNYDLVARRAKEVEEKDRIRNWRPPVNGDEIMKLFGLQPGIEVGLLKKAVESAILDGIIQNDHDAAISYLKENKEKILSDEKKHLRKFSV
ncbi:MAG: CCA tRNA nucleotidyltransferase [Candidatus Kryptoniota bacterium]